MALSPHMNVMLRAAEKAAKSLTRDFGEVEQLQVSRKGPGNFVSAADHRSEEIIFNELSKARPDYGFLMEERGNAGAKEYEFRWIVDPLDGTFNFLHGIPHWNITIALEHKGEIIAGIVHDPIKNEMFRAEKGGGAFMVNKRLRVSGRSAIDQSSVVITGCPRHTPEAKEQYLREYNAIRNSFIDVRRFGAAALDMVYVAAGRAEAFWERDLNPWDVAAGTLIVREAGGSVGDIDTNADPVKTGNVIAANGALYNEVRKIISTAGKSKSAA